MIAIIMDPISSFIERKISIEYYYGTFFEIVRFNNLTMAKIAIIFNFLSILPNEIIAILFIL